MYVYITGGTVARSRGEAGRLLTKVLAHEALLTNVSALLTKVLAHEASRPGVVRRNLDHSQA